MNCRKALILVGIMIVPAWGQKNTPPVAQAGGPYAGLVGQPVTFVGTGSYDPDLNDKIILYEWDLDNDGQYEAQGSKVTRTYYQATSGTIHLRVWDTHQVHDVDSTTFKIKSPPPNQPPVADAGGPYSGAVGKKIKLDGSGSYDPDGTIMGWHWDLDNDGQYDDAFGETVEHQWSVPYTGTIGLRVIDAVQAQDTDSTTVTVTTPPQTGRLEGHVFHDLNRSGKQEQNESGLRGWTLFIDLNRNGKFDQADLIAESHSTGYYRFDEIETGTYPVGIILAEDIWEIISPSNGTDEVTITVNQMVTLNFAVFKTVRYDYGDLPDPCFPTLQAHGGARHRVTANSLCLGTQVDTEADGQASLNAWGDDFDGRDDEDGIVFRTLLKPGHEARFDLTITNRKVTDEYPVVACWLDINGNNSWDLPLESVDYWLLTAVPGENQWDLPLTIPTLTELGSRFIRFRLFRREDPNDAIILRPSGDGGIGEVEDYRVIVVDPDSEYDFADAPQAPYDTRLPDGAWHSLIPGLTLGDHADAEDDGQPNVWATGDGDDEDGVAFTTRLVPGESSLTNVRVMNYTAATWDVSVSGWIDFDGNGQWDMDEHVTGLGHRDLLPMEGAVALNSINVPLSARPGRTYARYRMYAREPDAGTFTFLTPTHYGAAGEVEDYALEIGAPINHYIIDRPDPNELGGWELGVPQGRGGAVAGNPDPATAFTGTEVYGVNLSGDYETDASGPHYLELGPYPADDYARVTLRFYRWLNSAPEVRNTVEVRNSSTPWTVIWSSSPYAPTTDSDWQYCEFDLTDWAGCGNNIYIRWGYEVSPGATAYSGWNLDDIGLLGTPNALVPFNDINLKAAVLNRLVDIGASDMSTPPTACQMQQLTSLNVQDQDIHDLTGLEFALNLTYLNAEDNHISDLSPLENLHALEELHLARNEIIDLRPLENLTTLWNLSLSYNNIQTINALHQLHGLTHLYLAYNQIERIDVLDWPEFNGFNVLDLGGNLIQDIDSLRGLPRLWSLILTNNEVVDIAVLEDFPQMNRLTLNGNHIARIEVLRDLTDLTYLNLRNNDLDSEDCDVLDSLRLSNPGISITPIAACP